MRRAGALAVLLVLALGAGAGSAAAHGEYTPTIVTIVDGVQPEVPGLRVRVVRDKAAQLDVVNHTGRELAVLAAGGDPFLKIGPRGVYANVNSTTWYQSGNPDGVSNPPKGVRIGGRPRFVRVSRRSSWRWFDHRMHPGTVTVGRSTLRDQAHARLDDWTVPARLGKRNLKITGHVEYRPLRGNIASTFTGPAEPAPGVQAQFLAGRLPGFFLINGGREPVTVLGRDGRPFARIGPRGVEVNLRSPTYAESQAAKGERALTPSVSGPAVQWRRIARDPQYSWLDGRTRYDRQEAPAAIVNGSAERRLSTWSVPIEVGSRRVALRGQTRWVPLPEIAARAPNAISGSEWVKFLLGSIALALVLGGAMILRLRASRRPERAVERV